MNDPQQTLKAINLLLSAGAIVPTAYILNLLIRDLRKTDKKIVGAFLVAVYFATLCISLIGTFFYTASSFDLVSGSILHSISPFRYTMVAFAVWLQILAFYTVKFK